MQKDASAKSLLLGQPTRNKERMAFLLAWVDQLGNDFSEFQEAAGPAMDENQGDGVWAPGPLMHKVQVDGVHLHREMV